MEFKIVLETLSTSPYLLLDDIHHIKHYSSYMHIASDPVSKSLQSTKNMAGCWQTIDECRKS